MGFSTPGRLGTYAAWFLTLTIPSILGIYILMLEGYHLVLDGAVQAGMPLFMAAVIFSLMTVIALFISFIATTPVGTKLQQEFMKSLQDSAGDLSIGFFVGFIGWPILLDVMNTDLLSSLSVTVPALPLSTTLSSTNGVGLSEVQSIYVNAVVAPPAEELFFGAGVPVITLGVISILIYTGIPYLVDFLKNSFVQLFLITFIPSIAFATFHTDVPVFSGFWMFAFVFSMCLKGLVYLEAYDNIIPSILLLGSFSVGTHMGNNFHRLGGFFEVMTQLMNEPVLFMAAFSIFVIYGLSAAARIVSLFLAR